MDAIERPATIAPKTVHDGFISYWHAVDWMLAPRPQSGIASPATRSMLDSGGNPGSIVHSRRICQRHLVC